MFSQNYDAVSICSDWLDTQNAHRRNLLNVTFDGVNGSWFAISRVFWNGKSLMLSHTHSVSFSTTFHFHMQEPRAQSHFGRADSLWFFSLTTSHCQCIVSFRVRAPKPPPNKRPLKQWFAKLEMNLADSNRTVHDGKCIPALHSFSSSMAACKQAHVCNIHAYFRKYASDASPLRKCMFAYSTNYNRPIWLAIYLLRSS